MAADLLSWAVGVHAVILPLSLVALYRYSDRTDMYMKTFADMEGLLDRIRAELTGVLESELGPVFEEAEAEPRSVTMKLYSERATNPVGSEKYRQALRRFVEASGGTLIDYVCTCRAKRIWCRWARFLSWEILALAAWQVVCLALLGLAGKLFAMPVSDTVVRLSFIPSALLILLFFLCHGALLRQHDVIHESKNHYPSF